MKHLFWNTNGNTNANGEKIKINPWVMEAIIENDAHIVGLGEYKDDLDELLDSLRDKGLNFYQVSSPNTKICVITRVNPSDVEVCREYNRFAIYNFPHRTLGNYNIAFVHFEDKRNGSDGARLKTSQFLIKELKNVEQAIGNERSVVVGDFNMSPFEENMVSENGLNAISSRREAIDKKGDRAEMIFYNPMWNFLGDREIPEGTYYFGSSDPSNHYWYMLDQVIIRPEVIRQFSIEKIKIILTVGNKILHNRNGKPKISDHFPIYFEIT